MSSHNNNILINIPGHPYILMNRSILCNCDVIAESNFLLESLAACEGSEMKTDLEMHFTINLASVNYFDDMIEELGIPVSWNWTTQGQVLPLSLESFEINPNLLNTPKTLQDLAVQYRNKKNVLENPGENSNFKSFLNSFLVYILIFTAVLITLIITLVIIYVMYGQSKLKALVTSIMMQQIKTVEAADVGDMLCTCKTLWYIMGMLTIITLGMLYLVTNKIRKSFKERYSARRLLRNYLLPFYIMLKQGKTWLSLVPKPKNLSITNDNN